MGAHPCPGCLRVTSREGRCLACGGGTTTQRGYGADWQQRRARQLIRHPACEWTEGGSRCESGATEVDHIRPKVRGGGDEAANLRSLCARHHRQKTATEDRRWGIHGHGVESPPGQGGRARQRLAPPKRSDSADRCVGSGTYGHL